MTRIAKFVFGLVVARALAKYRVQRAAELAFRLNNLPRRRTSPRAPRNPAKGAGWV